MFRSTGSVIYIPRSHIKWCDILFFYAKQYVLYTILKWLLRNAYLYVCNTFHDDSIIILKGKMGKYEQSTNSLTIEQLSKECLVMDWCPAIRRFLELGFSTWLSFVQQFVRWLEWWKKKCWALWQVINTKLERVVMSLDDSHMPEERSFQFGAMGWN